ncbi:3-dehydroquinate synthase [Deinococcus sp. QL22]|uniref:3-dehydroquinate synthase n=1 Tax=Deinococcus sp. QL22 TaxID=2939437 RepID=UPI002016D4F6|nr:3-dehydroquinate synthase [Deinococcus sp. QL22]UQN08644.1 3-dehydroquinate synthase [Deinococcus sp. QL22]
MARTLEQSFQVRFHYAVEFTSHLFDTSNAVFATTVGQQRSACKVLVVMDDGLVAHHPELPLAVTEYCQVHRLNLVAPVMILPGGEAVKQDPVNVTLVQDAINMYGIDRHSFVVVVGGGALIDLVGYAAATAHRGVRLIRVPTTVLSQNDSAVGVKNSVNAYGKKNWLGTFAPPFAVLNDLHLIETLENRDWLGGLSEAVKVALLKDEEFFAFLEAHADALRTRNLQSMEHAIYRCAQLHLDHIATSGDAFEQGSSRPLDFGHWAAHKLEALTGYTLRHGEAVAMGIALDSTYAHLQGWLPENDWQRILTLFERLGLAAFHPLMLQSLDDASDPHSLLHGLQEFREHLGGQLTIMLLDSIGRGREVHEMDLDLVARSVQILATRSPYSSSGPNPSAQSPEEPAWTTTAIPAP